MNPLIVIFAIGVLAGVAVGVIGLLLYMGARVWPGT